MVIAVRQRAMGGAQHLGDHDAAGSGQHSKRGGYLRAGNCHPANGYRAGGQGRPLHK